MESADGENYGFAADPSVIGWDYQTFGGWIDGRGTGSGRTGAMSVGNATAGSSIPTSGSATFTGFASGTYADSNGEGFVTLANSSVSANFVSRTAILTTSNTQKVSLASGTSSSASNLNLTGTLTYSSATNSLATTSTGLTTQGGMSGSANARFYGPNAEEIGGVFAVRGTSPEAYQGAFGAAQ